MNKIKLQRKVPLVENPIFINGISRVGKFFLCRVISGFEDMEYFQSIGVIEDVALLEKLGKINEDAALYLLQTYVDEAAYNMRIGRNLNFRYDDGSSVANSLEADRYLKRSLTGIDKKIAEEIQKDGRRSLFVLNASFPNIGIFLKTFPRLQWINLIRHPVDIIHSWYLKGYGRRYGMDPLFFSPVVEGPEDPVPCYAIEWAKEYSTMSEFDRIIKSVSSSIEQAEMSFQSLSREQKGQVYSVRYENIVSRPNDELKKIAVFLKMPISQRMPAILAREKCPKEIDIQKRSKKVEEIKAMASKEMFKVMMSMALEYEKKHE